MFTSPAYAQAFGDSASTLVQFAPFVLIFVVFYFFVIRPQQQKTREHRNMLGALRRGDLVVTRGGIMGTAAQVAGGHPVLVAMPAAIRLRGRRSPTTTLLPKTAPTAPHS